jgi:hypothetical protein
MGGFSESDFAVLANTHFISQDISEYGCPNVELVVSPVGNAAAPTTKLTCSVPPAPDFRRSRLLILDYQGAPPRFSTFSSARQILGAIFRGKFCAFFVPGPTLTFSHLADHPHWINCG